MNSNYFINFICRFFWICCVHNTSPGRNDNFISSFPILSSIYFVYLFIFVCCIFTQLRELRFSLVSRCLETRLRSVCGWSVLRGDSPSEGPAGCRLWGWSPGPLSSSTPGLVILYLLLSSPMPQADGFNCFDCLFWFSASGLSEWPHLLLLRWNWGVKIWAHFRLNLTVLCRLVIKSNINHLKCEVVFVSI